MDYRNAFAAAFLGLSLHAIAQTTLGTNLSVDEASGSNMTMQTLTLKGQPYDSADTTGRSGAA